ncbi:MFS transporter [Bradyrhizobium sp. WBAH42]|nr:MFS transporter [Bradyrhizobium sp. WBAH30]MDD1540778.1 MFS transporter [Bradyrhizobium sp. WBAH41]MDD1555776.1 MFS transporter [Bradyrhizobium sp. WBAH23]MDD1563413.1 MFS transporter [Bradyrhizobium sp. WBAH33]MDD1588084.1 MFS transporter [Bradyrhizobium sp. WBAH42]NRB86471.1 MFS transporter [Bradyrhizobium sp. WBAH10]QCJ90212.1 MFS transporter [Bradyrhizobium yuanmingense]
MRLLMSRGTAGPLTVVVALGTAQTIAWASSYYLPAILAAPIAGDLGLAPTYVFAALSGALIISGLLGPRVGHAIDTFGGRSMLAVSNLVFAAGLLLLSAAYGVAALITAWILLGIGMGMGLYEAAFATLARIYGADARRTITGITLIAGFASTLGWPLTTWLATEYGWRAACQLWAVIHIGLALPLNLSLPRAAPLHQEAGPSTGASRQSGRQSETFVMILLAYMFAAASFVSSGVSAILPTMLIAFGATPAQALLAGALVGPAQVGARLLEAGWLGRFHPLLSARLAMLMNPIGVLALVAGGPWLAPAFAVLYGAGNGIITIARGTLPLALFGPVGFGRRVGMISLPSRATGAFAPLALGLMVEHLGSSALWISALASVSAFFALLLLRGDQTA